MDKYSILIGKNRNQVLKELGDEYNIPYSKIWSYRITNNFLFKKTLLLYFDEDFKVERFEIRKKFFSFHK